MTKVCIPLFICLSCFFVFAKASPLATSRKGNNTGATVHRGGSELQLHFRHTVKDSTLQLNNVTYTNALGQPYILTKFKYYIGRIYLKSAHGRDYQSEEYFLIDEEEEGSKVIRLQHVPPGEYTAIGFLLGVDSLHNCSGAQSGALDPLNGMFWNWNTGYIFMKLEGRSPASPAPAHLLEYHIGGYAHGYRHMREVQLSLPGLLQIQPGAPAVVHQQRSR
ncbi:MAG: hypothetical protein IPN22_02190 [Bacteroidetes bacterium]|nr:hypothetical protein [Bacteroidota bacterium]